MMTRRRIHVIYFVLCLVFTIPGAIAFLFFVRDFSKKDKCRMYNVLTKTAYLAGPVLLFSLGSVAMFINYAIIIYKLTTSRKPAKDIPNTKLENHPKNNMKLTRAIIMTLTAYILFFIPVVALTSIGTYFDTFTDNSIRNILEDISLLCYFSNNLVNPFIYYMTLRDFRDGYRRLLFCCVRQPVKENPPIDVAVI